MVVGGGPAGLAVSQALVARGVDHVVLERAEPGATWATQRWDSFRLNTPGWMNHVVGEMVATAFPRRDEVVAMLTAKAATLPMRSGAQVVAMEHSGAGFAVRTPDDELLADTVVLATGGLNVPRLPTLADALPDHVLQLHTASYRSAGALPDGAVLVVGSGQSGGQIAEDLALAGRRVYLATSPVGRFRWNYRARETIGWLVASGFWGQRPDELAVRSVMRWAQPLVASGGRDLNLPGLAAMGVTLVGRLESAEGNRIVLDGSLTGNVSYADEFSRRICAQIDAYIEAQGVDAPAATEEVRAGPVEDAGPSVLDLAASGITSVIWCTGFTGDFSYLPTAVLDERGQPRHDGVVTPMPGLFLVGVPWLVRRDSGILHGMPTDAETAATAVSAHLAE